MNIVHRLRQGQRDYHMHRRSCVTLKFREETHQLTRSEAMAMVLEKCAKADGSKTPSPSAEAFVKDILALPVTGWKSAGCDRTYHGKEYSIRFEARIQL